MSVEIREDVLDLRTYVWGNPDPNPAFQRSGHWRIYPYPLLDDIREEARVVPYRAFIVENEYLRVTVLPELGGRIYSALDKRQGEEIFYRNNVVKPGLIALRGAWISGGVEWNFPCGHSVTTVSPVDARMVEEEDGSAAIWVGNVEQIYRMSWAVGIRLRPESSLIETEIVLANRTDMPHPYYFWANAAVPASDDMRLIYPGTRVKTWGASYDWPVHEGTDLARYTAFEGANDVFLADSLEDFFGVYYEDRDFGLAHVADVHQAFGKKFFTWGTSDHGKVWSAALSDADGPYSEVQSGRFVDQGTWRMMPPHWGERWVECWYPVKGMGGFTWANKDAAVRVAGRDGKIECGAIVTRPYPKARVRVMSGEVLLKEERADLSPDRALRMDVSAEEVDGAVTLVVLDEDGGEIIRHTQDQRPSTIALPAEQKRSDTSPGELVRRGLRAEERAEPEAAWELYERALMIDPGCDGAALALGRLAIEHKPEQAVARMSAVAAERPESAQAAYYLGVALARAGREQEAEAAFRRAADGPDFGHAAQIELGLAAMRSGQWERAASLLHEAARSRPDDMRARAFLAAALRKAGRPRESAATLEAAMDRCPADRLVIAETHFCMEALSRPRLAARRLRELREMVPSDPEPWLELALDYVAAGLIEEADELLEWAMARSAVVRRTPVAHYLLAHLQGKLGRDSDAASSRQGAAALSPDLIFPHRWEMERILREAAERNPDDVRAAYYLGSLLYRQGRCGEALDYWQAAAEKDGEFSVLHRNLALAYKQIEKDLMRAEQELRRAVELRRDDLRLYLELNDVLKERGAPPEERLAALDGASAKVQRRGALAAQQIACCLALENWDRAIELLSTHTFHRWEMEFRMRRIYLDAYLGRGAARFDAGGLGGARADFEQALEYPMNLRIGRSSRPSDARARWCAGVVCEALGDAVAARAHWEAAAVETHHHPGKELAIYQVLSLQRLGRVAEAEAQFGEILELAQQCADLEPEDANAQFSLGLALKAAGRSEQAEGSLRRALELDPAMRRAQHLLDSETIF